MTGCEFCSGGDCGSGDYGAGEVAVGAMEAVGSFKHSEVFKKMNFIFPAVGSGGCGGFGGGVIEEEVKFLTPICSINYFSSVYSKFLIRSEFSLFLSTEISSHLLFVSPV